MYFSPAYISSLIVQPLRFLYGVYAPADLQWNEDGKISNIEIDTINNFNKILIQSKPRILVSRGGYTIRSTGISDNMAEGIGTRATGPRIEKRFFLVDGIAQILVESRNEGTCEKVVELTENFLTKSGPAICSSQGFKQFAFPLSVSPCTPNREDTEIFQCTINVPWAKEMHFQIAEDGLELKNFIMGITPQ